MKYNIGIIGGGQLGMMMALEAKKLNLTTAVLDPNINCSCKNVADKLITGSFNNVDKLNELGEISDVLSYEFENVSGDKLKLLHDKFKIPQGITPLLDSQDRLREKENAHKYNLPTVKYMKCSSLADLERGIENIKYPLLYKTRRDGYDGHGQVLMNNEDDIKNVLPYINDNIPGIIEEKILFDYECSIIMIRDKNNIIHFPLSRNIHHENILDLSIVDDSIPHSLQEEIIKKSEEFMIQANYYGILTIEYFIKGDKFYFNEMAPRVHNSGHYTIEGCNTNQFKELDKFLTNQELTTPALNSPTIMKNILGRDLKNLDKLMKIKNAHLHMYNKDEVREKRKLGHITYTDITYKEYLDYKNELNIEG